MIASFLGLLFHPAIALPIAYACGIALLIWARWRAVTPRKRPRRQPPSNDKAVRQQRY